jgi:hypothetical protein
MLAQKIIAILHQDVKISLLIATIMISVQMILAVLVKDVFIHLITVTIMIYVQLILVTLVLDSVRTSQLYVMITMFVPLKNVIKLLETVNLQK